MIKRDEYIDFLRFLGLTMIILVHVQPDFTITQLRCFDVPLMVFVSGLTASNKIIGSYSDYFKRRTKRLVLPVWIFLGFYLTTLYLAQFYILQEQYLTGRMIIRSFLLLDESIGYVWIIRVFLLVMLVTPILQFLANKTIGVYSIIITLTIWVGVIEVVHYCSSYLIPYPILHDIYINIIQYTCAYSLLFYLGLKVRYLDYKKLRAVLLFVVLCSIILLGVYYANHGFPLKLTPTYKEPPHSYYLVYGVLVSLLLWYFKPFKKINNSFFVTIGQNTIWIYLWHMPFVLASTLFDVHWSVKFIFVYSLSVAIFLVQKKVVNSIDNSFLNKYFLG